MKKIIAIALLIVLIFSPIGGTNIAFAHSSGSYAHDTDDQTSNPDWMSEYPKNLLISDLSIPGTHDSMTYPGVGGAFAQCQVLNLDDQLHSGIRALDIRCAHFENPSTGKNAFFIFHGAFYQGKDFDDVLETVQSFLEDHPGETVLMRVKPEDPTMGIELPDSLSDWNLMEDGFDSTFEAYAHQYEGLMWTPNNPVKMPQLRDVRGKIVILQDFSGTYTTGTDSSGNSLVGRNFGILYDEDAGYIDNQDMYTVNTSTMYAKWVNIKNYMKRTNNSPYYETKLYVNHLSANGVTEFPPSAPYFIASGHVTADTDSPRLWTGYLDQPSVGELVINTFLDIFADGAYKAKDPIFQEGIYPDFPRDDTTISVLVGTHEEGTGDWDWIWNGLKYVWGEVMKVVEDFVDYTLHPVFYEGMNELAVTHLNDYNRVGIIMADFPGPDLIDGIIQMNPWRHIPDVTLETPSSPVTLFSGESVSVNATFTDVDDTSGHTSRIDWGDTHVDNQPPDDDLILTENTSGPGTVSGSHQYFVPGTYTATVSVTDEEGNIGDDSFVVEVLPISVDITFRTPVNSKSNGAIQVVVYGKTDFDVSKLRLDTIRLGPSEATVSQNATDDVNGDGYPDQILHFRTEDIGLKEMKSQLILTGQNTDGIYFEGKGTVKVFIPKK